MPYAEQQCSHSVEVLGCADLGPSHSDDAFQKKNQAMLAELREMMCDQMPSSASSGDVYLFKCYFIHLLYKLSIMPYLFNQPAQTFTAVQHQSLTFNQRTLP